MGSRLTEIVVDCHDPAAQAAFWAARRDAVGELVGWLVVGCRLRGRVLPPP